MTLAVAYDALVVFGAISNRVPISETFEAFVQGFELRLAFFSGPDDTSVCLVRVSFAQKTVLECGGRRSLTPFSGFVGVDKVDTCILLRVRG